MPDREIAAYVARVRELLTPLSARERDDALGELSALLVEDARARGTSVALSEVGPPEEYAEAVLAALRDDTDADAPQGRVLGIPYDFRGASADRLGARVWNPSDPRVFTPRLFGLGWTVNFGALAVKLGLLRPDDLDDDAYDRIPRGVLAACVTVPGLLAAATLVMLAVGWAGLPAEVPVHWGPSGAPDRWADRALAVGFVVAVSVLPVAIGYLRVLRRGVPARTRVLISSALALLSTVGLGVAILTVVDARGGRSGNYMWLVIIAALVVAFLLLYVPTRFGLRAEWRDVPGTDERD